MRTGGRRLSASGGRRGARQAVRQWRPVQHRSPPAGAGPSLVSQSASPSLPERAAPPAGPAGPRALGGTRHCGRGGCPGVQGPEASARATRRLPLCSGSESGMAPGITWGSGGAGWSCWGAASLFPLSPLRIAACTSSLSSLSWVRRPCGRSSVGAVAAVGPRPPRRVRRHLPGPGPGPRGGPAHPGS